MANQTISTFSGTLSFIPSSEHAAPQDIRQKAEAEAQSAAEQSRLDRLPGAAKGWADRHTLPELELLGAIMQSFKAEGFAPVHVNGGAYAARIKASPDDVRARLDKLLKSGAVTKTERLAGPPVFKPHPKTSETTAAKAEAPFTGFAGAALGLRQKRDRA
ncbi:hypothetical protein [Roseococcus sp.]|uniref:hypothetical protein n=1 Tax=Roseococcus sp. TaxID=2109646 RepID=UPI003BAC5A27